MNINLIRKMVSSGVLRQNTEIRANYRGVDLSGRPIINSVGDFFIQGVKILGDEVIFETVSVVDGSSKRIKSSDVISMDGMPVQKIAIVHGISDRGDKIKEGKRRGRKPKAKI